MRHRKSGLKLNRTSSHRKAMFRNMATSFFRYERIHTTDAKARELRRLVERLITLAKRGDLHARRQALSIIREKAVVHKLFDEIGGRFSEMLGGYTRIIKLGRRKGDAAPLSLIELVDEKSRGRKRKKWGASAAEEPEKKVSKSEGLKAGKPENEEILPVSDEKPAEKIEDSSMASGEKVQDKPEEVLKASDDAKAEENISSKEDSGDKS